MRRCVKSYRLTADISTASLSSREVKGSRLSRIRSIYRLMLKIIRHRQRSLVSRIKDTVLYILVTKSNWNTVFFGHDSTER